MKKKIIYVDMDGVIADFHGAIKVHPLANDPNYKSEPDHIPNIFRDLKPIEGAIDAIKRLTSLPNYEIYILTTAPWGNPDAWTHKRLWIEEHFGTLLKKKVIISHHKNLLKGDFLIDDRTANGVDNFEGRHIHFGWNYEGNLWNPYPDWNSILLFFEQLE